MKNSEFLKKIKEIFLKIWSVPLLFSFVLSFVLVGIVEVLARHDLFGGFQFLFEEPIFYLMTVIALTAAFSLTYFVPKRIFAIVLIILVVMAMAIVNFVLLFTRVTPFEAVDFSILRTGISLVYVYLNTFQLILCIGAIVTAIGLMVLLFIKCPKVKVNIKEAAITSTATILVAVAVIFVFSATGIIPSNFKDTNKAYEKYGFIYCFTRSIFDRGIDPPDNYNEESVGEILDIIDSDGTKDPGKKPNVIIIQLESFMDPYQFKGVEFEKNPIPNFTALKESCTSGKLFVPSVGSGTANTEFEVLTGMCLDYFGTGEYPYKTILQSKNCETVCYNLAEIGYNSHAFHNHTGTFYNRNIVYKNLGFNTFTPLEYMSTYDVNPLGWAKDYVLEDEIIDVLDSTKTKDLVFAVSVQGHGKYPEKPIEGESLISVSGVTDEAFKHQLEYYAYQLYEMDDFIGRLTTALEAYDEECILVIYGDHQPSLNYADDDILYGDKHASEYVIWSNFEMTPADKDLEAYQLTAYALQQVGINNGLLTKLHQIYSENEEYESAMKMLEYDMLYGDMLSYSDGGEYVSPDMKLGFREIKVSGVSFVEGNYYILGENFTKSSDVYINGKAKVAHYISPTTLLIEGYVPVVGDTVVVKQITNDLVELGKTQDHTVKKINKTTTVLPDDFED